MSTQQYRNTGINASNAASKAAKSVSGKGSLETRVVIGTRSRAMSNEITRALAQKDLLDKARSARQQPQTSHLSGIHTPLQYALAIMAIGSALYAGYWGLKAYANEASMAVQPKITQTNNYKK